MFVARALGVRGKLPRQSAALLHSFAALTGEEQLLAYEAITEYLQAGETRLAVDPELQERATALRVMRTAVEHLGLTDAGKLLVREFNAAPKEVRDGWTSSRVIRAWGSWTLAKQALTGGRKTETARQRALRTAFGVNELTVSDYLAGVRAWLATNPPTSSQDAYRDWAREQNLVLREGALPYPVPLSIRMGLNLRWATIVEVARGEISIDKAKKDEFRHQGSASTGEHDLVTRMDVALITGKHPGVVHAMTRRDDFPTAVLVMGGRHRYWLREDVEAYLAGQEVPERTENELGDLYVNVEQVAEIVGVSPSSIDRLRNIPAPVFRGRSARLWRRSDIEAFKKERERAGVRRGKRAVPRDQ